VNSEKLQRFVTSTYIQGDSPSCNSNKTFDLTCLSSTELFPLKINKAKRKEAIFVLHKIIFFPSKDKVFEFTLAILLYETHII
jgi:hypothetical protein